ncbi:MAG: hypothetical protein A3H97_10735 [Acidobacteria bacterium RIFCSPLOWO2_02_FULL_65_29]|nr:MAG: hypothetical protein A3H97_10735 [Acidobacteria bacterium RIFCSPLOWO2_02_FULL_65_29]
MNGIRANGRPLLIGLALALLMAATRFHHFGSATHLPDASLAVFFLGGVYLRRAGIFAGYLAGAALIDYLAIAYGGASGWCVTPAYAFLVPTYACTWYAGVWYARRSRPDWRTFGPLLGALLAGVSAAFLVSDSSFYLLSGYFSEMSGTEYATRVAKYYPPFLSGALLYVALAALVHALLAARVRSSQRA